MYIVCFDTNSVNILALTYDMVFRYVQYKMELTTGWTLHYMNCLFYLM